MRIPIVLEPEGSDSLCGPSSLARLSPDSTPTTPGPYSHRTFGSDDPQTLGPVNSKPASSVSSTKTAKDRFKRDASKGRKSPAPQGLTVTGGRRSKSRTRSRSRQPDVNISLASGLLSVTSASEAESTQSVRSKKRRRKKKKAQAEAADTPEAASGKAGVPGSSTDQIASHTIQHKIMGLSSGSSKDRSTDFTSIDQSDDSDDEDSPATLGRNTTRKQGKKDSNVSRGLGLLGSRRKRSRRKNIVVVATPKHF